MDDNQNNENNQNKEKIQNKENDQKQSSTFTKTDFENSKNNIRNRIKKRRKLVIILGIVVIILIISGISSCVNSCNNNNKNKNNKHESYYVNDKLNWPSDGIVSLLPKPESENGKILSSNADYFHCYVAKTDEDAFNNYINECKNKGFNLESDLSSSGYKSKDQNNNLLDLYWSEYSNEMTITLESKSYQDKAAAEKKANEEKKQAEKQNNNNNSQNNKSGNSSSVSADLKSFLDSYEQFVDKYVAFMKKYKDSGNPLSMLKDYTDLMAQLADFNGKIANWDSKKGSMSAKDLAYYTEVTTRCAQKMASVA